MWIEFVGGGSYKGDLGMLLQKVKDKDFIGADEAADDLIADAL